MSNANLTICALLALLSVGAAVCWLIDWHDRTYVRRIRGRIDVAPHTMRGFMKAWQVGGCGK